MPPERDREPGLDGRRLETLFTAGNWERLVEEARRFLALQPDHPGAHYSLAWALTELKKYDEAGEHVRFLLAHHPEAGDTHRAAAFWYRRRGRGRAARRHIREGLRLDPEDEWFHRMAALDHWQEGDMEEARLHIDTARALSPDEPVTAALHVQIHGGQTMSARDSLARHEELGQVLQLDPENAYLHHAMGIACMGLEDHEGAESHFREAVRLEPSMTEYQESLFAAVAMRSLTYRVFGMPVFVLSDLPALARRLFRKPSVLLYFLLPPVAAVAVVFLAWLLAGILVFGPGLKAYELLLVAELRRGADTPLAAIRTKHWLHRRSFAWRIRAFVGANLAAWGALFALLGVDALKGFAFVLAFVAANFILFGWIRWVGVHGARRARARQGTSSPCPACGVDGEGAFCSNCGLARALWS